MIDTLIICITVLLLAGGLYHFSARYLTTSKAREEALAATIGAYWKKEVIAMKDSINAVHDDVEKHREELKKDIIGLFDNQKNLTNALTLTAKGPSNINSILENLKSGIARK